VGLLAQVGVQLFSCTLAVLTAHGLACERDRAITTIKSAVNTVDLSSFLVS